MRVGKDTAMWSLRTQKTKSSVCNIAIITRLSSQNNKITGNQAFNIQVWPTITSTRSYTSLRNVRSWKYSCRSTHPHTHTHANKLRHIQIQWTYAKLYHNQNSVDVCNNIVKVKWLKMYCCMNSSVIIKLFFLNTVVIATFVRRYVNKMGKSTSVYDVKWTLFANCLFQS
jgi:hypothetical protein